MSNENSEDVNEELTDQMRLWREQYGNMIPERIVDTRVDENGKRFYKVQWAETTMEPGINFLEAEHLIQKYWNPETKKLDLTSKKVKQNPESSKECGSSSKPNPPLLSEAIGESSSVNSYNLLNEATFENGNSETEFKATTVLAGSKTINTGDEDGEIELDVNNVKNLDVKNEKSTIDTLHTKCEAMISTADQIVKMADENHDNRTKPLNTTKEKLTINLHDHSTCTSDEVDNIKRAFVSECLNKDDETKVSCESNKRKADEVQDDSDTCGEKRAKTCSR